MTELPKVLRERGGLLLICDVYKDNVLVRRDSFQTARTKNVIKVGRLQSAPLRLDDDGVSRMHAVIEVEGDEVSGYSVQIIDLGTATGTFVTSARSEVTGRAPRSILKQRLFNGDRVRIGPFTVLVYFDDAPETPLVAPVFFEQAARYPEHEKMNALLGKRDAVARFLEWMETMGYVVCAANRGGSYRDSVATYEPVRKTHEEWLADHFGIDLAKIAAEKAAMHAARKGNA